MRPQVNKKHEENLEEQIGKKIDRKIAAGRYNNGSIWSGFGMFGIVGWSVAVPTLLGTSLGIWLDKHHHQSFSWTLSCLIIGLFSGCVIAWYWVFKNSKDE